MSHLETWLCLRHMRFSVKPDWLQKFFVLPIQPHSKSSEPQYSGFQNVVPVTALLSHDEMCPCRF